MLSACHCSHHPPPCPPDNVSVRAFIGYNSLTVRAIRKILETPGLTPAKVSILVGGPDWPTSVCCGILKLPLLPMLIGNSPVAFVILAITLAGSLQLRKSEGWSWMSISNMTLGIASAVTFVTLVAAAYYIEVRSVMSCALDAAIIPSPTTKAWCRTLGHAALSFFMCPGHSGAPPR